MTTILCTLYNSLYLDKGLVLYDSLCECAKDFKLYVLCMDEKCYDVLKDLNQEYHIPVRLSDFEQGDEALLKAKVNRTNGEYCWTCSSSFIRYVLIKYKEPICTYIDADMYFYSDPQVLVDEMLSAQKSVMVTPHRFPRKKEILSKKVGAFCVEFNTFMNTPESVEALEYWRSRCLECCSNLGDGIHWGDQKYLEELIEKYSCIHICENPGAGIAPWNIEWYKTCYNNERSVCYKADGLNYTIVFYHYQGISVISDKMINIEISENNSEIDYSLVDMLYKKYLYKICNKKEWLKKKHNIDICIKIHPAAKNNLKAKLLSYKYTKSMLSYLWPNKFPKYHFIKLENIIK